MEKMGNSQIRECKWASQHTGRDSNPHYSLWTQWWFWLLLLLAKCNWDMACTWGPSVCKSEDGGRTATAELSLPCCCLQRRAYAIITNMGDVFRHGIWNNWPFSPCRALPCDWEGAGKPAALAVHRRLEKPHASAAAAAALAPVLGNKVWGGGNRFQHKVNITLMLCWSQGPHLWLLALKLTWAEGTAHNNTSLNFTYSSAVLCSFPTTDV